MAADLDGGRVLFSTRRGGVSEGPFASLNLGRLTADDAGQRRREPRAAGRAVGVPRERSCTAARSTGRRVRRATEPPSAERPADRRGRPGDRARRRRGARLHRGLPARRARRRGRRRGAARRLARPGRRDPRRGRAGAARARRRAADRRRARPGARAAAATRPARRSTRVRGTTTPARGRAQPRPRRRRAAQLAGGGRRARSTTTGCARCARPALFFSHRRDGGVTGRQAGSCGGLTAAPTASARTPPGARGDRGGRAPRGRDPAGVELLAAVKYVRLEELGALAEAGITLVGENRAQELAAKARRMGRSLPLGLHRPAPEPQGAQIAPARASSIHSVASESALRAARAPRRRRRPRCSSR